MGLVSLNHSSDTVTNGQDNEFTREYIDTVCSLTNYPEPVVTDILKAIRIAVLEEVADYVVDLDELPDSMNFMIPLFGEITMERLLNGRTDEIMYTFKPTNKFKDLIKDAYYRAKTPLEQMSKKVFDNVMEFRSGNIIREE